jgi:NAD(P)-dependent dehydrogenase (short-subunit alcohol dehydrogenase family)
MSESGTKIALVTGASRGLGRNTATALARKGVDVIGTYHSNKAEAAATISAIEALGRKAVMFQMDIGKASTFAGFAVDLREALATTWGRKTFDYLVNNAGIGIYAPFAETTEADFDRLMNIQVKGVFFLTQTLLPLIANGGRIVNLSSGLARFSLPGYAAYAMTKGAVEVLTRYLAKELGSRGIAANTVAPGAIETDFAGGSVRDDKQVNDFIASVTALGRAGLPDDIGPAVASLLTEDNRWINAQRIEVSGGMFVAKEKSQSVHETGYRHYRRFPRFSSPALNGVRHSAEFKLAMINGLWDIDGNQSPFFCSGHTHNSFYRNRYSCIRDLCRRRIYRCRNCHPGSLCGGRVDVRPPL